MFCYFKEKTTFRQKLNEFLLDGSVFQFTFFDSSDFLCGQTVGWGHFAYR